MRLQLTKAIIYFAAILLLCIGFNACEKEDENILNSNDSLCEVSFFDHKIQDEALSTIIDSLVTLDQNKNFTDRISLDYGYPLWEHAVSVSNEYVREYRIPLVKHYEKEVNTIWVFIETYNSVRIKILNKNRDAEIIGDQDWEFFYMTEKIFGSNDKPTFIKEKRHTKGLVYGEITDCFIQRAFVNGYENDSMWRCRTTFGYRYIEGHIYHQMGPLQRPGDEDFSLRGGGSSGLNTPPGPRPLPEVDEDKSFKNTKADCVYDKLKEGGPNSIMNQLLGGYMLDKKKIQLTFKVAGREMFKKDNVNGRTIYDPNTKTSVIYLNNKTLTRSPLEIARTILHECFHAYLHSINPKKMNSDYSASFEKLMDNYNVKNGDYTHNDMANKYRDEIEKGLRAFVNTNEDLYSWANQKEANDSDFNMDDLLESIAWEGLQSTKLFNEKYANNKSLYEEEIVKYRKLLVNENGDFGTIPKDCN